MRRFRSVSLLAFALVAAPTAARAQLGVDFTSATGFNSGNFWSLGWSFAVNTPFTVGALGFYDDGKDGLTESHDVGLFNSSGTLLASATVTNSNSLTSFWRFANIAPLALGTGNYVIAATTGTENYPLSGAAGVSYNPNITFLQDLFIGSSTLAFPTSSNGYGSGAPAWLAPNFLEANPNHPEDVVPEPATMSLLATGLAGLAAAGRRKKILRS